MLNLNIDEISKIRQFNRLYTIKLGTMDKKIFNTKYSWSECKLLIEMKFNDLHTVKQIAHFFDVDKSYVSKIINKFISDGLLIKTKNVDDLRSYHLRFTDKGIHLVDEINKRSNEQIIKLIENLTEIEQKEFYNSIEQINKIIFKNGVK